MKAPRILIAGVGNIFLGDDAFGSLVASRLAGRTQPQEVRVVDFGIRGLDLAYALLDGYGAVVLIDAMPRGGVPGTLYLLEPTLPAGAVPAVCEPALEMHGLDPVRVLRLVATMGSAIDRLFVVGCEPSRQADPEDMQTELSPGVVAAVEEAVLLVEALVGKLLRGEPIGTNDTVAVPEGR